jgi:hypothetical protein
MNNNNDIKKILKGILLHFTSLYFFIYLMSAESLFTTNFTAALIGLFLLIILIGSTYEAFKNENLIEYIPKYFR